MLGEWEVKTEGGLLPRPGDRDSINDCSADLSFGLKPVYRLASGGDIRLEIEGSRVMFVDG